MFKVGYSQNGIPTYSLHYKNFFIVSDVNNDSSLNQKNIQTNLSDGEYFIYYDSSLTKLWMNGYIFNNKLEGKWEFWNRQNQIFYYRMFSEGIEVKFDIYENTFAKIYLPNKTYDFAAYYIDSNKDTITKNRVIFKITSQLYEVRNSSRFNASWIFEYNKNDSVLLGGIYPWNDWEDSILCIITESSNKIEIYPPRANQFAFTEVIGFPTVYPSNLKIGFKWENYTFVPKNYWLKEWENNTFYHNSEIAGKILFNVSGENIDCWVIKGTSFNENFGTSHVEYLFNEEYGFVRMEWVSYDKQKVLFVLENVKY